MRWNDDPVAAVVGQTAMYEAYFTRRLLEELTLAERAGTLEERSVHLRACHYYRDMLLSPDQRKAVRHPVKLNATLLNVALVPVPAVMSDLSTSGFHLELPEPLEPGMEIEIALSGLETLTAEVVWCKDGQAGCRFLTPLHHALLEAAIALNAQSE
jgi:hypothetical protein